MDIRKKKCPIKTAPHFLEPDPQATCHILRRSCNSRLILVVGAKRCKIFLMKCEKHLNSVTMLSRSDTMHSNDIALFAERPSPINHARGD